MPLTAISGTYQIVGFSPDGDTVCFVPDDPGAFAAAGLRPRVTPVGAIHLRLDAIDALETHYKPHSWHQQPELGDGAANALLDLLGFTDVQWDERHRVSAATPKTRPGYILTGFVDKYGRAVSFAFAGMRAGGTKDPVYLEVPELRRSVNHQLLGAGWAYPTFYSKLYADLREELATVSVAARAAKKGVWEHDSALTGFELKSQDQLQNQLVILPKLFRRLVDYFLSEDTSGVDLAGFATFLKAQDDKLFTVPAGQATSFAALVESRRQRLTLTVPPEQLVFVEAPPKVLPKVPPEA
ncbi:hypothetical protein SAMN05421678_103218 [Actinopolymorpha cephalotaxi]|uniref:Endonuclease YncB(Thermonuclease family) n=1 Tax=Actinopolymorpha cephalotaxi TaxID=504797 RepID=A0A1I2N589_9ACTN|nr:thermonuclease family protein [Actinopolymorpha cephalotaxi]NYH85676.1 endonuclease YncB(thermonuclease family) [Actinopolymorpha cephalotaxi]SFF98942.1 hypothetical protein SAMN05421678_103218 [Actinopolymorpha cephalotaxi]